MLLALLIGIAGGFGAYWLYGESGEQPPAEIPTIKAEGPVKQRPEQPGGIDIPHQNETVFQQIDSGTSGKPPAVEHLLPPPPVPQPVTPEAPAQNAQPEASPAQPQPPAPGVEKLEAPSVPPPPVTPTTVTPESPTAKTETPSPAKAPETKAPEVKKPEAKAPAAKTPAKQEPVGSLPEEMFLTGQPPKGFYVQLGSFPAKSKADSELGKMQKKYADTLSGAKLAIKSANLGRKGTYYRIQGGPLAETEARSICNKLWSQKAPCIIVKP